MEKIKLPEEIEKKLYEIPGLHFFEDGRVVGEGVEGWYLRREEVENLIASLIDKKQC